MVTFTAGASQRAVDMTNPGEVAFLQIDSSSSFPPSEYSWFTANGHDIQAFGINIAFNLNGLPTDGAANRIEIDFGNNNLASPDVVISNIPAGSFLNVAFLPSIVPNPDNFLQEVFSGGDLIDGSAFSDKLKGVGGSDTIDAGAGADWVSGGVESDFIRGGAGADTLDGGAGNDTVFYNEKSAGVSVNLMNGAASTGGFVGASGLYVGGAQEDALSNVESVVGGNFADRLIAGSASARIDGLDGNDFLFAFSGNDTIFAGSGDDFISGGHSTDALLGEAGNDTLNGGTGFDALNGGDGVDTIDYSDRTGGIGANLSLGAVKTAGALNSAGFYSGGFTEDSLFFVENVIGSNFADRIVATNAGSRIDGRGGNDNISGLNGADTLNGGAGNDTLGGGSGGDSFVFEAAGGGSDRITDFVEGAGNGDLIRLVGFGATFDDFADVIGAATEAGADVILNLGAGATVTIAGATIAGLAADDFAFG